MAALFFTEPGEKSCVVPMRRILLFFPCLLYTSVPNAPKFRRRIENATRGGHEQDWVRACKENPETRVPTASDFSEAGPFNEMVVMGVLAVDVYKRQV